MFIYYRVSNLPIKQVIDVNKIAAVSFLIYVAAGSYWTEKKNSPRWLNLPSMYHY
jgi:hypothetical protein